jgi:hypothetical protein
MCRQHNEIIAGFLEINIFNSSRYKFKKHITKIVNSIK